MEQLQAAGHWKGFPPSKGTHQAGPGLTECSGRRTKPCSSSSSFPYDHDGRPLWPTVAYHLNPIIYSYSVLTRPVPLRPVGRQLVAGLQQPSRVLLLFLLITAAFIIIIIIEIIIILDFHSLYFPFFPPPQPRLSLPSFSPPLIYFLLLKHILPQHLNKCLFVNFFSFFVDFCGASSTRCSI